MKKPTRKVKFLLPDERHALDRVMFNYLYKPKETPHILAIWIIRQFGPRPVQVKKLKKSFFDFETGQLYIPPGKQRANENGEKDEETKARWLGFPKNSIFVAALKEYLEPMNDDDSFYPYHRNTLANKWDELKPFDKTLYCLRHDFAMRYHDECWKLYRIGKLNASPLGAVQYALGHSSIETTQIYLDDMIYEEALIKHPLKCTATGYQPKKRTGPQRKQKAIA